MNLQLREGQIFPKQYVLSRGLHGSTQPSSNLETSTVETAAVEEWIATHNQTADRVLIRFVTRNLDDETWSSVKSRIESLRGLVHQNISLSFEADIEDGIQYLVEPYLADSQPLSLDDPNIWPLLQQILDALAYAHHLGITHGTLHPDHILVDSSGIVHITGFAMPAALCSTREQVYLSPQVRSGRDPGIDDDIYSLGCIVFRALTGKHWRMDVELDQPLDARLENLLRSMLSESPFERPTGLAELRESLGSHFEGGSSAIESVAFSRTSATTPSPTARPAATSIGQRQDQAVSIKPVLIAGAGLFVFAALLFTLLPESTPTDATPAENQTAATTTKAPAAPSPASATPTPLELARLEMFQKEGEAITREILRLQLGLEDLGVLLWAPNEYDQISASLETADSLYRSQAFEEALDQYEAVQAGLTELTSRAPAELNKHIVAGDAALLSGDAEAALTSFTIATTIDRDDKALQQKLARAETLDEVQVLVREAEVLERNGELQSALATFTSATKLDNQWLPAKEGLSRLQSAITQSNFQNAMSEGFRGISNKDYDAARAGFSKAKRILPNSDEPRDGLLQVEQAERNDAILGYRKSAEAHLGAGNWQGAISDYEAALAIADSLEFAITGLTHAKSRLALQERLQRFLSDPTLLQSSDGLEEASNTLREASRVEPKSDKDMRHINLLARVISTARIEIPVTITSDGNTNVTVRRHAALGKITSEVVYLIPGRYTIVGNRQGYRDVREDIVILAGESTPDLRIASTERIR